MGDTVYAISNWDSGDSGHLPLHKYDVIRVVRKLETGWTLGEIGGKKGWFPTAYSKPGMPPVEATAPAVQPSRKEPPVQAKPRDEWDMLKMELKRAQEEKLKIAFELSKMKSDSDEAKRMDRELEVLRAKKQKLQDVVQLVKPKLLQQGELEHKVADLEEEKRELVAQTEEFKSKTELIISTLQEKMEAELREAEDRLLEERNRFDATFKEMDAERAEIKEMVESIQDELRMKDDVANQREKLQRQLSRLHERRLHSEEELVEARRRRDVMEEELRQKEKRLEEERSRDRDSLLAASRRRDRSINNNLSSIAETHDLDDEDDRHSTHSARSSHSVRSQHSHISDEFADLKPDSRDHSFEGKISRDTSLDAVAEAADEPDEPAHVAPVRIEVEGEKKEVEKKDTGKKPMNITVNAKYDWVAKKKNQINFKKGDDIAVTQVNAKGWFYGSVIGGDSKEGWFPSNYIIPPKE